MPTLQLKDGALFYALEGQGPPLTLIHGVGGDHELWNWVIDCFKQNYQILRLDLRGHGLSVKSPGPYSLELFRDDLLMLLDQVGFEKTHLAGFSLGGLISQKIAIDAGHRLHSTTIVSAIAGRNQQDRENVLERAAVLQIKGPLTHLVNAVDRWFTDEFRATHPEIMEWRRMKSLQNDPASYAAAYRVFAENDLAGELGKVSVPLLAITGENDIGSPPRMSRLIGDTVENGRSVVLPGLKHSVLLEAPEIIAGLIESFIREQD